MNANIKRTRRTRKDFPSSAPLGELPLSIANTGHETSVGAPPHSTPQPSPKSGEASAAQETGLAADSSSPAPGADVGSNSAPSAAAAASAESSLQVPGEDSDAATVGVDPSKALTIPDRARLALKSEKTERDLLAMVEQSKSVTAITNPAGRQQAHAMLMGYVNARTTLDEVDEEARKELKALNQGIIDEKKRLAGLIASEEKRIRELRDAWDKKVEDEKKAKAEAEQRRKEAIEARIEEIRNRATEAMGKPSADIAALIEQTTAIAIDDTFAEFKSKAESVQKMTLDKLRYFHQSAVENEDKARELAEQEKRLAAERESQRLRERRMEVINDINGLVVVAARGRTLATYDSVIERLEQRQITAEEFGDLVDTAIAARDNTLAAVRLDRDALAAQLEQEVEAKRKRIAAEAETARLAEQKREQDRQAHEADEARKLRDKRIGNINFIRAVVGMSASLETVAEFDSVIADTTALDTSVSAYGDLSSEATSARDSTLEILQARRDLLVHRLEIEASAASRETVAAPTDPAEATDGELLSSATLFGDAVSAELPPEPDAPSVDEAILTTLDLFSMEYGLDDARGKELIVRMGARVTELAA